MNDHEIVVRALELARFAYPVAIHPGQAPEIGAVLEVHAFDVPEQDAVRVSFELTQIVRKCKLAAVPLVGCYDMVESDEQRECLPPMTWWYRSARVDDRFLPVLRMVEGHLALDRFPYRVALFPGHTQELGSVVEVFAFNVPEAEAAKASSRLNNLLASLRLSPMPIGSVFGLQESMDAEGRVPPEAHWFQPSLTMFELSSVDLQTELVGHMWERSAVEIISVAREVSTTYRSHVALAIGDIRWVAPLARSFHVHGMAFNTHYSLAC